MTVADTSRESYKKLRDGDDKEKTQCRRILDALKAMDYLPTANELNNGPLADMNIPNGRVSARLNKLMDMGLVQEMGKRPDRWTGRTAKTYIATGDIE